MLYRILLLIFLFANSCLTADCKPDSPIRSQDVLLALHNSESKFTHRASLDHINNSKVSQPMNYKDFMQDLQKKLKSVWKPVNPDKDDEVRLSFIVRKDGSLVAGSINTIKASNPKAEAAAKQAVITAAPSFSPLPKGSPDQVMIDFKFTVIKSTKKQK